MDKRILTNLYIFLEKTAKNGLSLTEVRAMSEVIDGLEKLARGLQNDKEESQSGIQNQ